MKNPHLAFLYSLLLPGAGQLYLGEQAKGWTLLCMDVGVAVSLVFSHTGIAWFLMGGIYLAIMIPAALDAFQAASGRPRTFTGDGVSYVIVMLLMVGPFAIPLLWKSPKFSTSAKIICTVAVILIALGGIVAMSALASFMEALKNQNPAV